MTSSSAFRNARAHWGVACSWSLVLLLLQAVGAPLRKVLAYDRSAILAGEAWRLVTGHLVHLGWNHVLLNGAGLLLCCALAPAQFAPARVPRLAADTAVLAFGVSLLLLVCSPQVSDYVGLSGVLYGLYVLGLAPMARRRDPLAAAALLLVLAWMAWQLLAGTDATEEAWIGGAVIARAHLYGVATAAALLGARATLQAVRRAPRMTGQ